MFWIKATPFTPPAPRVGVALTLFGGSKMIDLHQNPRYVQSLFFVQIKNITKRKVNSKDFY